VKVHSKSSVTSKREKLKILDYMTFTVGHSHNPKMAQTPFVSFLDCVVKAHSKSSINSKRKIPDPMTFTQR